MILGVEHIALSCDDVGKGARLLAEAGYRVKFIQEDVPNHPSKLPLLASPNPLHSVAYCQGESGVSLELTQHSNPLCDKVSPYQVLLNRPPTNAAPIPEESGPPWERAWCSALGCVLPVTRYWPPFHAQIWSDASPDEAQEGPVRIRALLMPVGDVSRSEKFWVKGLGCRVIAHDAARNGLRWMRIAFQAPVPAWSLDVVLVESDCGGTLPLLDDPGFPCVAVITNRLVEDQETVMEMGGHAVSDNFVLEVGGNTLRVLLLRGPDNELVEMIEFQRS